MAVEYVPVETACELSTPWTRARARVEREMVKPKSSGNLELSGAGATTPSSAYPFVKKDEDSSGFWILFFGYKQ